MGEQSIPASSFRRNDMKLTDQVQDTVTQESKRRSNLVETIRTIDRLRAAGLIGTPSYRFPLPDTIGRHLYDAPDSRTQSSTETS
jgi:hypothetical protein